MKPLVGLGIRRIEFSGHTAQLAPRLILFLFGSFPVASQRLFEPTYDARTASRMLAERTRPTGEAEAGSGGDHPIKE